MERHEEGEREREREEALILVGLDGRIYAATPRARRWLAERFGRTDAGKRLPLVIREWLQTSGLNGGQCRSFTHEDDRAQLVLSLLHPEADGAFTILVQKRCTGSSRGRRRHLGLTRRQSEVHALLKQGKKNSEIAKILGIGEATAKRHVEDVLARLHARNRTAAAAIE